MQETTASLDLLLGLIWGPLGSLRLEGSPVQGSPICLMRTRRSGTMNTESDLED